MNQKLKTWTTVLALLAALLFAAPASADYIYQYTDENGHVRFTDDPGNVPEEKRSDMKQMKSDSPAEKSVEGDRNRTDRDRRSPKPRRREAPRESEPERDPRVYPL